MITHTNKIDIVPGGRQVDIYLNQYDEDFLLVFNLFARAGTLVIEEGTTAAIRGTKPDGNGYSADATIDVANARVTVDGDQQMTVCTGRAAYEIVLYKDGKELSTGNFVIHTERAALDKDTPTSRSQTRELVEIEARALDIISAAANVDTAAAAVTNLAPQIAANAETATAAAAQAQAISASLPNAQDFVTYVKVRMLLGDNVENTTQAYTFDGSGNLAQVTHTRDNTAIRTDAFTYGEGTVTEVRTLNTGETMTFVTTLATLATTVTYAAVVAAA